MTEVGSVSGATATLFGGVLLASKRFTVVHSYLAGFGQLLSVE